MKKRIVDQIRSKLHNKFWWKFDYLRLISSSSWTSGSDKRDFVFEVCRNDLWPKDKKIEALDEMFLRCQRSVEHVLKKILKDEPEIRYSVEVVRATYYNPKPYIQKLVATVYYRKERAKRLLKQQSENDSLWEILVR